MTTWHEYVQRDAPLPEWPYPIRYGEERALSTDVLVLGGGIAGCHAAIGARRKGAKVVVLEKEATKWSGNGVPASTLALGLHQPCSGHARGTHGAGDGRQRGLRLRAAALRERPEGWDASSTASRWGADPGREWGVRGRAFRDPETRLLFAYDYENRCDLRVHGHNMSRRCGAN